MVNDMYRFHSINLNHSVVLQLKLMHKIQVLVLIQFQLHFHIVFQEVLLNDQNPTKKRKKMNKIIECMYLYNMRPHSVTSIMKFVDFFLLE